MKLKKWFFLSTVPFFFVVVMTLAIVTWNYDSKKAQKENVLKQKKGILYRDKTDTI